MLTDVPASPRFSVSKQMISVSREGLRENEREAVVVKEGKVEKQVWN
jgi:hypothetical protein